MFVLSNKQTTHGGRADLRRTGNLPAVQLLLGHSKIESTVRYLGGPGQCGPETNHLPVRRLVRDREPASEVDEAIEIAEKIDI